MFRPDEDVLMFRPDEDVLALARQYLANRACEDCGSRDDHHTFGCRSLSLLPEEFAKRFPHNKRDVSNTECFALALVELGKLDPYQLIADAFGVPRDEAKLRLTRQLYGGGHRERYSKNFFIQAEAAHHATGYVDCEPHGPYRTGGGGGGSGGRIELFTELFTDDEIRELFNSFRDGTATDALGRQLCQVALGECCVFDKQLPTTDQLRYPTKEERGDATVRLAPRLLERRRG